MKREQPIAMIVSPAVSAKSSPVRHVVRMRDHCMMQILRPLLALMPLILLQGCHGDAPATAPGSQQPVRAWDVRAYGAAGDGTANDAAAIQKAIDACAAAGGGTVRLGGRRTYRSSTFRLRSHVTLSIEKGATLLASAEPSDYAGPAPGALIEGDALEDVMLAGEGTIDGVATRFMGEERKAIYVARAGRPVMVRLVGCRGVAIRQLTLRESPFWCIHLCGCEDAKILNIHILNNMKVPNCDGIDIDHCRRVEVRDCTIRAGDDCICLKTTREYAQYGACADVRISNCTLTSASCALKIGTETGNDVRRVRMEACRITDSNRGLGIMLRDAGNVDDIVFSDIRVETRLHAAPWWGHAEAIYVTALPRRAGATLGQVRNVQFLNITARGEGGVFISGSPQSRPQHILLKDVALTIEHQTEGATGMQDRRPTTQPEIVAHRLAGIYCESADYVEVDHCRVEWGAHRADYFGPALETHDVQHLEVKAFRGQPADLDADKPK